MLVDSPGHFASHKYDYLIVGGGTAGLVLAARLTEDPNVSVGVIEAGQNRLADPNILVPGLVFSALGQPGYDWNFNSTPQAYLNGRIVSQNRGKVLGGSSAINGMMCTYSSTGDIDNWAKLGNVGWSHEDLAPYYEKFESFMIPSKEIAEFYHSNGTVDETLHNGNGPVRTSFAPTKRYAGDAWVKTFDNLGLRLEVDPQTGKGNGGHSNLITVDAATGTRSYAGTAYFAPNAERSNLTVLVEAQATKIKLDRQRGRVKATGVHFTSSGSNYLVEAKREVILCCGAFQSPHLLELSGIGSRKILEPLGIEVIVESPHVGENLQDHATVPISFVAADGADTFDNFQIPGVEPAALADFYGNHAGLLTALVTSNANLSYQQVAQKVGHVSAKPIAQLAEAAIADAPLALKKQYTLLRDSLLNQKESVYQFLYTAMGTQKGETISKNFSPGNYLTLDVSVERPYSRGTVHISTADPLVAPSIDPNYLSHPLDVELYSSGVLFSQFLATQEPFASKLKDGGRAFHSGFSHLTKKTVSEFCREAIVTEWHSIGTCSMMPQEDGGVVDARLRTYGVDGLRVVDASIFPMEIRNNLQTAVYAVAEKAADMIKEDWKTGSMKSGHKRGATEQDPKRDVSRVKRSP